MFRSLLILIVVTLNFAVAAGTNNSLRVLTEHLPPYQIAYGVNLKGGTVGLKVQKFLNSVVPSTAIEVLPWNSAYNIALNRPNTLIFSITRTPEREDKFIWITKVANLKPKLYALKKSNINPTTNLSSLERYTVGTSLNDLVTNKLLEQGFNFKDNLVQIVNADSIVAMLHKGRLDLIAADPHMIEYYCKVNNINPSEFIAVYDFTELNDQLYLAASKRTDPNLIEQLIIDANQYF
jgi:polar amino acid transport system substrate-binding protein